MKIAILGPVEVRDTDGRPIAVSGGRLQALLVRLALDAGLVVSASTLVDAVWGDEPPSDAANAVQTLVSRLRRALGDPALIVSSGGGYRLEVSRDDVDAHRFERQSGEGRAALRAGDAARAADSLADALALWRGVAIPDAGAHFDAYVTRLHELKLEATLDLIEAEHLLGNVAARVAELDALAAEHPLNERVAGLMLTALAAAGRPAEALAAYEQVRERLATELGSDPSAQLQSIHVAILRGEVGDRRSDRKTNLRAQLTSFVGRDDDIARIGKSLEQSRLVTLVGPGGAGKTRLATEAASNSLDRTPDGVWLVELAAITDAADVAEAILGSLGLREAHLLERRTQLAGRDATSRLVDALGDKRSLIVLDNCEHLIETSARLADHLLAHCPQLRVLATSREPLGIFGETLLAVLPLGQPAHDASAAEALEYPAVRLFADRAAAVRPDFTVDDETVATVISVVRRLDGLPLAIELAAARLRSLALADIAARLSDRFRLLTGGSRSALPRHRTLRAVVEWSWELLSPPERVLAERLSVFPAGATAVSAAAVCGDRDVPDDEIADLMSSLVDKSLLQPVADATRVRMLETIREYGAERLAERDELGDARIRHARYFAGVVREASEHLRDSGQLPWIRLIETERDNIVAALRYLADEGQAHEALEVAAAIGWYWMLTGAHAEAATWLRFALEAPGATDPDLRLLVRSMMAITASSGASPADGDQVEEGFIALRELSSQFATADVQRYPLLAMMRPVIALFSDDTAALDDALDDALNSGDPWIAASALMFHATVAENNGDRAVMRRSIEAAYAQFDALGERWGLASCLHIVGVLRTSDGDLDGAIEAYERALELVRELGSHDDEAWLHLRLAEVYLRRGEVANARRLVERGHALSEESGSAREALFSGVMLADIARRVGDVDTARRLGEDAIRRLELIPPAHPLQSHGLAMTLAIVARHDLADGELDTARQRLARAYEYAMGTKDMPIVAHVGVVTALVAEYDGDLRNAAGRLGAAARLRGAADATQPDVAAATRSLRDQLGDAEFDAAYAIGLALTKDEAIAFINPS